MTMIKLYTKTICPKCMATKNQLNQLGIEFEAINLDEPSNESVANDFRDKGYMAAPVMELDGVFYSDHTEITKVINELAE